MNIGRAFTNTVIFAQGSKLVLVQIKFYIYLVNIDQFEEIIAL